MHSCDESEAADASVLSECERQNLTDSSEPLVESITDSTDDDVDGKRKAISISIEQDTCRPSTEKKRFKSEDVLLEGETKFQNRTKECEIGRFFDM